MGKVELGKQVDKFVKKENITDDEMLSLMQKFVNHSTGLDVNIDVKKLRGKWKGYHRIRVGKIRILHLLTGIMHGKVVARDEHFQQAGFRALLRADYKA